MRTPDASHARDGAHTPPDSSPAPAGAAGTLALSILACTGVALVALCLALYAMRAAPLQWDLRTYLAATRATLAGINPYRVENLADFAGRGVLPFVYPLPALVFFLPLIPLATAPAAFIGVKLALLAGLVAGWAKALRPVRAVLPLALLAVFGWNGAALWDLRAGNVAIVECGLLWGAFACFVAGRRAAFAVLVVMAATFKVFPLAFLLLLLVPAGGSGPRPWLLAGSLAAFVAAVVAPMRIGPAAGWEPFFAHVPMVNTIGEANPSAIGFATLALQRLVIAEPLASRVAIPVWVTVALALVAWSLPWFRAAWRARNATRWVMGGVVLYVLLLPRPMAYGYVLLAPAPLFLAPPPFDRPAGRVVLALILSAQGLTTAMHHGSDSLAFLYAPLLLTLCVWLLAVEDARRRGSREGSLRLPEPSGSSALHELERAGRAAPAPGAILHG